MPHSSARCTPPPPLCLWIAAIPVHYDRRSESAVVFEWDDDPSAPQRSFTASVASTPPPAPAETWPAVRPMPREDRHH